MNLERLFTPRPAVDRAVARRVRARVFGGEPKHGRWILRRCIGQGASAVVFAAHDPVLERNVALKLWRTSASVPSARQRLLAEARALAKLSHPNVVTVYEVDASADQLAIAMELVEGSSILEWTRGASPSWRAIGAAFADAARGLAAAHAAGVIHCDVKPSNLVIGTDQRVRVVDFGLATSWATRSPADAGASRYTAPEQHLGGAPSPQSDQYALCVSLHECLHGRHLEWTAAQTLHPRAAKEPMRHGGSRALRRVLRVGLSPDPSHRFATLDALAAALERAVAPRPRWRIPLALATLATLGMGWQRPIRCPTPKRIAAQPGPESGPAVAHAVDRYASALADAHVSACRRGVSIAPETLACLGALSDELELTISGVAGADASAMSRVVPALADLRSPWACGEPGRRRAPRPDALVGASVARRLGQFERAIPLLDRAVSTAATPAEEAAARLELARLRLELGEYSACDVELRAALRLATLASAHAVAADAWVLALRLRAETGVTSTDLRLLETMAHAAVQRAGGAQGQRASLEDALGDVAHSRGDLSGASRRFAAAARFAVQDPYRRLRALRKLGSVKLASRQLEDAEVATQRAARLARVELGEHHPETYAIRNNAVVAMALRGEGAGALQLAETLADQVGQRLGGAHPDYGRAQGNVGVLRGLQGSHSRSLAALQTAHRVLAGALGDGHLDVVRTQANLGVTLLGLGRSQEAVVVLGRASAALEASSLTLADVAPRVHTTIGRAYLESGDRDSGVAALRRGVEVADRRGADYRARARLSLASALHGEEAEQLRGEAAEICRDGWAECTQ